ncbi:large conductance mechanosensitive channel [Allocatelliglobosispora scoriae]|uniref:Large-conductance mechanosensitive channel n=1 Tax=Allocatelliglobosispora scoriae TaxID=643052 RepID=A0A841BTI4_9ACTN|nr:large conductance mechanosensitive channel protein MscL [Allocatelliglobosispora scoriae]MBB5870469.1 large conductance mechanosensitive channel [Allocatelliglobosispora scoriae]
MLKGFRDFITRGNVVDLAVGIVIGAAFGAVINQFTQSFLEPLIKVLTGGNEVGGIFKINGVPFDYGAFINAVITFLLTALALYFFVVVPVNRMNERRARAGKLAPEEMSDEVRLLTEIRDGISRR